MRVALCLILIAGPAFAAPADDARFFDEKVAPIIEKHCVACHNEELKNANISFLDRDSLLRGGTLGPAIIPGNASKSLLVVALRHEGELQMPPGPKLSSKEISVFATWIKRGAPWGAKLHR